MVVKHTVSFNVSLDNKRIFKKVKIYHFVWRKSKRGEMGQPVKNEWGIRNAL